MNAIRKYFTSNKIELTTRLVTTRIEIIRLVITEHDDLNCYTNASKKQIEVIDLADGMEVETSSKKLNSSHRKIKGYFFYSCFCTEGTQG